MKPRILVIAGAALLIILVLGGAFYTIQETEQIVMTQFGKPIGEPFASRGLHVKVPFIQKVNRFERRWLEWDGDANQVPTKDKKFIWVDAYARWRIADPLLFFQSVRDERGAQTRLDDILDGATRKSIANWDLIEVVRSRSRALDDDPEITEVENESWVDTIEHGRHAITRDILGQAAQEIRGRADAEATRIYAEAYERAPGFYAFLETLKSYETSIDDKTWLVLSTDGDFYRYLKDANMDAGKVGVQR